MATSTGSGSHGRKAALGIAIGIGVVGLAVLCYAILMRTPGESQKGYPKLPSAGTPSNAKALIPHPSPPVTTTRSDTDDPSPSRDINEDSIATSLRQEPGKLSAERVGNLLDLLARGTPRQKMQAAYTLAESIIPEATIATLVSMFRQSPDPGLRTAVLTAVQNCGSPETEKLLRECLQSRIVEERDVSLGILAGRVNSRAALSPDFVDSFQGLREQDLTGQTVRDAYRVIGYFARNNEERCLAWLKEDAMNGRTDEIKVQSLKHLPASLPDFSTILESSRNSSSAAVQEEVVYRASAMIATSKDPKLLSILISFLGPQPNPNTQEIAFEGVERVAPFLSLWGDKQLQATAAVKAGLSTFLATSPPHLQAERAERLLLGLSR